MQKRTKNIAIKNDNKKQSLLNAINNQIIHFNNNRYNLKFPLSHNRNKSIGISKSIKLKNNNNKKSNELEFQKYYNPSKYNRIHLFKNNNLNYDISKYKSIINDNNFKYSNKIKKIKKINLGNECLKNEELEIKNTKKIEEVKNDLINNNNNNSNINNGFILNDFIYYVISNDNINTNDPNQPLQFKCASLFFLDDQKEKINDRNKLIEKPLDDINDLDEENKKCDICQKKYALNEDTIILPCSHFFHKSCIFKWFENNSTCPICYLDLNHL